MSGQHFADPPLASLNVQLLQFCTPQETWLRKDELQRQLHADLNALHHGATPRALLLTPNQQITLLESLLDDACKPCVTQLDSEVREVSLRVAQLLAQHTSGPSSHFVQATACMVLQCAGEAEAQQT